jgi:hypothetical protein
VLGQAIALAGVTVSTFTGERTVAGPVVQAIAVDLGIQAAQTANRAAIYKIDPKASNRVNTAYMVAAFCGQLSGTAVGNRLYSLGGWKYSGAAGSKSFPLPGTIDKWLTCPGALLSRLPLVLDPRLSCQGAL